MRPYLQKIKILTEMPPPQNKQVLLSFLGILNYLSKYSTLLVDVCKPLKK